MVETREQIGCVLRGAMWRLRETMYRSRKPRTDIEHNGNLYGVNSFGAEHAFRHFLPSAYHPEKKTKTSDTRGKMGANFWFLFNLQRSSNSSSLYSIPVTKFRERSSGSIPIFPSPFI